MQNHLPDPQTHRRKPRRISSPGVGRLILDETFLESRIAISFPKGEDGEPEISITEEVISALVMVCKSSLVVNVFGSFAPLHIIEKKLRELWKPAGKWTIMDLPNGYYVIRFETKRDYYHALDDGPWTIFGHYLITKEWSPLFNPEKDVLTTASTWVQVETLPIIFYEEGLIKVDAKTLFANTGRFPHLCVEVDLSRTIKGAIHINGERYFPLYENLHLICEKCRKYI
ncbi:LOW QUALITY PROTEIN: hypothetical protein V2J09_017801 [Rumex salicifolius]